MIQSFGRHDVAWRLKIQGSLVSPASFPPRRPTTHCPPPSTTGIPLLFYSNHTTTLGYSVDTSLVGPRSSAPRVIRRNFSPPFIAFPSPRRPIQVSNSPLFSIYFRFFKPSPHSMFRSLSPFHTHPFPPSSAPPPSFSRPWPLRPQCAAFPRGGPPRRDLGPPPPPRRDPAHVGGGPPGSG